MLFNSLDFALFLPIVFIIYWALSKTKLAYQNFFVLCASFLFYGWWDWRFLCLIALSIVVDYFIAKAIDKQENKTKRKQILFVSIFVNIGLLFAFKYFNFFLDNISDVCSILGVEISLKSLNIILPVGISFYTFQTLSYTIDVYRNKIKPTNDFVAFAAFVSFFPQLVAGPIERATNLLPQFLKEREFDEIKASDGLRQMLWGLFKKVVIADNCATYADLIFNSPDSFSGITLILGAVFFAFQIYCDFSGYSDIAIGSARLFGFNLKQNFAFPYFSRDIAEFWRRWHISLTTWFRDYIYIPLGGSRVSKTVVIRNVFIIFLISGFWHGAKWNFIFWGFLNALYFIPLLVFNRNRKNLNDIDEGRFLPSMKSFVSIGVTFSLTAFSWIFFRAESMTVAFGFIKRIFIGSFINLELIRNINTFSLLILMSFLVLFILIEWVQREKQHGLQINNASYKYWFVYLFFVCSILLFGGESDQFIYFQF